MYNALAIELIVLRYFGADGTLQDGQIPLQRLMKAKSSTKPNDDA